ncbi:MAG: hypothetical protein KC933_08675 [Myxococcales bacterium]|nr:hypothetical protein [Myxococcales bacterium]MCB9647712.1 hypothetical protein [Deltaproteobacteria bacterium]
MRSRTWPTLLLPLAALSCTGGNSANPPPEVLANASAAVDEGQIRASTDGAVAQVAFQVEKRGSGMLEAALRAELVDVTEAEDRILSVATTQILQDAQVQRHEVRLAGLPAGLARADTAGLVVRWRVATPSGTLFGSRSLYTALGTMEVQVRGATELAERAELWVLTRDEAGAPVAGAQVQASLLEEAGQRELATGATDDKGELLLQVALPEGVESGDVRITVRSGDVEAWTNTRLAHARAERLRVALDKTIYQPGQTLHARLIGLTQDQRLPLADREVAVEAMDAKGNKVFKRTVQTDAFGVAAVDIPTDTRVNEGDWKIRASAGDVREELTIPVLRYNLPKLKVAVESAQAYLQPGQTIQGTVRAHYLFGMPVTQATVQVQAKVGDQVVAAVNATTDAEGSASYTLQIPAQAGGSAVAEGVTLTVEATVTDAAGQAEIAQANLRMVKDPLVVRVLPEVSPMVAGLANRVYVLVADPLGRPVVANVDVSGDLTQAGLQTDARGVASFEVTPSGSLELNFQATDGADRTASRAVSLTAGPGLLVRTDHAFYGPGQEVVVQVQAPSGVSRAFVGVRQGGEGRLTQAVSLEGGRGSLRFTLGTNMQGGLLIDAFAMATAGEVLSGQRRLYAQADDRLQVELTASADTYGPGEEAVVTIRALDPQGQPKVAAVGLTAVDEAVFALGGEPGDDLRTFFSLDPRVLPAATSALGQGPKDLLAQAPGADADALAALLFAASGAPAATGVDYNSVVSERPRVAALVEKAVVADVDTALLAVLNTNPEQNELPSRIEQALLRLVDPFGHRYQVENDRDQYFVKVTSSGPDERPGTADDVTLERWYQWLLWGERDGVDLANGAGPPAPEAGGQAPLDPTTDDSNASGGAAKVRSDFRETVFANPWLVTDGSGTASVRFPLADSITTWRLSADAHTQDGRLGSARLGVKTFQDFFVDVTLPTRLTVGDEIEVPAVVYNYLDTAQDVRVAVTPASWMTVLGTAEQTVHLEPSEVRAARFRIRVDAAGDQSLTLQGNAGSIADALVRTVAVVPNGTLDLESVSDKLGGDVIQTIEVPVDALEGGTFVSVSLTPGFAAEAVQGLEGMLQEPNGCFEQTTSSAWPNTLVAEYMVTTGQMTEELREEVLPLVQRGYQRLLTFESPTGGFNWWGDADPGNRILSAIMLWHLKDLESLIEIDTDVRDRTLQWLIAQQQGDGHFASGDALHAGNEVLGTSDIRTTAFITWALAHTGWAPEAVTRGGTWLQANLPDGADLYANALSMNALAKVAPSAAATSTLLSRLDGLKTDAGEGKVLWPTEAPSWTGAAGDVAAIETTGLVAYGLFQARAFPDDAAGAMRYLVSNKDAVGSWYNTQATMNALRALLAAASPQGSDANGTFTITVNGLALEPISVTPANGDLFRSFDITDYVQPGANTIALSMQGTGEVTYKLTREAYLPPAAPQTSPELALGVSYDATQIAVGAPVTAHVQATFTGQGVRDQVMVRVGRAPGFSPRTADLDAIVADGRAARYEVDAEYVTFYLMGLTAGQPRDLSFGLVPGLSASVEAPASEMYVYYQPDIRAEAPGVRFEVTE